jgi:hypothetical protein
LFLIFGNTIEQTLWPESASELYQPGDRRLLEKLVPTFEDSGVSRNQRRGSSTAGISAFYTATANLSSK